MGSNVLQIGEVATQSQVTVDAVRYYEKHKLLPMASRSTSGYRLFPAETVDRIRFIKQAQEVGFSLREISELFSTGEGLKQCRAVHDLILGKLTDIDARLQQMKIFRLILKRHLIACEKEINDNKEQAVCPVLVTIK